MGKRSDSPPGHEMLSDALQGERQQAVQELGQGLELDRVYQELRTHMRTQDRQPAEWLRSRSTRSRRAVVIGLVVASVMGWVGVLGVSAPLSELPSLATAVLSALVLVSALGLALRPMQRPELAGAVAALLAAAAAATALLACWMPVDFVRPASGGPWMCLVMGALVAAPVYVLTRWFARGSAWSGWLAAVAAGMAGNLVLELSCPVTRAGHGLLGHASVVLLALLGYAAGCMARARPLA